MYKQGQGPKSVVFPFPVSSAHGPALLPLALGPGNWPPAEAK